MTTQSEDRTGIVAALTTCLAEHDGFINELAQFGTPTSERFYSRIEFTMKASGINIFDKAIKTLAKNMSLDINIIEKNRKLKTLIMVSKFDHCLADLIYRTGAGSLPIEITAIASNHETARHHADAANIPYHHIPITKTTKPQAEAAMKDLVESTGTELIVFCLLYTSPSPRDRTRSRMPSSA